MMAAEEQIKDELMVEVCLEDEECFDDEEENQEKVMQNFKDEESAQRGSSHTPTTSRSLSEDKNNKECTVDESRCEEVGEEMKNETLKKKRKKENKLFPCDKCSRVSHSAANLKKHMMTHTGEKPYECRTCHKSFRQRHHLEDHWRIHSGERPFKCDVCGSRFIQKSSLNLHKKRHSGIKRYSCTQCSYATYEKVHLIVHMRTHTGEKPYQCEKCGQTFSTATRLKFHRMIHTGERRYKCEKCGVPFREKVTLQAHMAVHLNLGPFECEECGQEFSRLAGLSLHRKVHDNKDNYLYVYNKEANQSFKSALKKASHKEAEVTKELSRESEKTPSSESDWETDSDDSPINTSEQKGSAVVKPGGQGTPATPAKRPLGSVSCLSPEDNCSPANKASSNETDLQHKLKENLASNLKYILEHNASDVPPDQVKEALEKGTVLETHGDDGKGFFIVLPPSLKNKDIMVLSDSPQSTATTLNIPDSSMTVEDRTSTFQGNISPNILSENVLETHKALYPGVVEVEECDMDSAEIEEEICSEVEGEMLHPCEAESVECIFNTDSPGDVLETLDTYSEAIEEHHPDGTSLLLWKDTSINQFTEVTYIIEDGKEEPIVIHTQEESCVAELSDLVSAVKVRKKRKCKGSEYIVVENEGSNNQEPGDCVAVKIKINSKKLKIKKPKSQRVYNCEQCGKACKNSSNYIAHLRTHSGERPYFCGVCRMGFKQISHLRSHIRVHTGERPYVCSLCNAAFTQSSRLNSHKKNVHPNGQVEIKKKKEKYVPENRIKNFFCRYCNKTFIGECFKIDHMKIHRPLLPYTCNICGMQFKNKTSMQSHSIKHSDCKHVCEMCGVEVSNLEALHKHRVTEHGRNLSNSDMLDMYINVKIGEEKDFVVLNPAIKDGHNDMVKNESLEDVEADLCEVKQEVIHVTDVDGSVKSEIEVTSTHVEDEVAVHDITHTSPEKERDNNTEQEKVSSFIMDSLKEMSGSVEDDSDLIAKEGEMKGKKFITYTDVSGKKIWLCKVCDRSFTQSSNLYCHMRMHTGDKPYRCNVCPRAFRQITHLKDHMRRHTGAKPHTCGECGKGFAQRSAVRRHIRVLHGGNAVAMRKPESAMRNQIIDTLSSEFDLVPEDVTMSNAVLEGKDTLLQDDEQICKLPHKENISHVCKVCEKQFTQVSSFTAHIRRCGKCKKNQKVLPADNKSCECGESFLSVSHLLNHQETCSFVDEKDNLENEMGKMLSSGEKCESDLRKSDYENAKFTGNKKNKHKIMKSSNGSTLVTQNQFKCKECSEVLHGITSYKTHLQGHGGELHQVCMMCGEVFKRASTLRYHQSMKHGREDRRYKDYCPMGYNYIQEENLEEKVIEVKTEVDYDESWDPTGEDKKEKMVSDVKLNMAVKPRKTLCKRETRRDLKSTKRGAQRNTTEKDIENEKEFSTSSTGNLEAKAYVCSVCGMAFTRSSKLRHHTAMWCKGQHDSQDDAATSSEGHKPLTEESTSKVNKVDEKPENPEKRQRSKTGANTSNIFSISTNLNGSLVSDGDSDVHTISSTIRKGSIVQSDVDFDCKYCDKHFPDISSCEKHQLTHAAEKPFKCEKCLLTFKRKAHLFNHYRRHTREECL